MAFPESYVNGRTLKDMMDGTLAVNLNTDTLKAALFTNGVTGANKTAVESYGTGAWGANETTGDGYTAGGQELPFAVLTVPSGSTFTLDPVVDILTWEEATFSANGVLIYDVTASNRVLAAINFGGTKTVISGTFTITWDIINNIFYWSF